MAKFSSTTCSAAFSPHFTSVTRDVVGVAPSGRIRSPSSALTSALFPAFNSPTTTSRNNSSSCRMASWRVASDSRGTSISASASRISDSASFSSRRNRACSSVSMDWRIKSPQACQKYIVHLCKKAFTFFNVWIYNCIMNRPFVFINVAMTADGKIDTFQRRGSAISSPRDKDRVDLLRADADAVMVGGRTLLEEDPKLTVKSEILREARVGRGLPPNPVKVGIVTQAAINPDSEFLNAGPADIVIFTTSLTSKGYLSLLKSRHVDVYVDQDRRVNLQNALATLKELGIDRLMVEGGSTLNFELMRLGLVDEVTAYVAPMIFGGGSAPTLAAGSGLERSAAIPLKLLDAEKWDDGGVLLKYQMVR